MRNQDGRRVFQYNFMQARAKNEIISTPHFLKEDRGRRLPRPSYFDHGPGIPRVGDKASSSYALGALHYHECRSTSAWVARATGMIGQRNRAGRTWQGRRLGKEGLQRLPCLPAAWPATHVRNRTRRKCFTENGQLPLSDNPWREVRMGWMVVDNSHITLSEDIPNPTGLAAIL
jgi:hypothetical protein